MPAIVENVYRLKNNIDRGRIPSRGGQLKSLEGTQSVQAEIGTYMGMGGRVGKGGEVVMAERQAVFVGLGP